MNTEIRTMVRPKSLEGKTLYCGKVVGSAISFDKFKEMVKCKLRCVGSSAETSVRIYWDNDRIECDLEFFEMWLNAVEDEDGFVTLRVSISGDCAGMTGGVSVDCAGMSGGCTDMASRGSIVFMENLDNNDVLENILFRLPFGVASQAKRVCKLWKTLLDNRRHNEVGFLFACHDNEDNKIQLYFGEEYDQID
ncbi:hypothetical protein MKW94_006432, partial [Papaver nudicaule]|nr:hypothetical protein [Papaver nudicaule]